MRKHIFLHRPEYDTGEELLHLDMNQAYILAPHKRGRVMGSEIFM